MAKRKTEIIINERWKIVREDALNWQPYQWREVEEIQHFDNNKRAGQFDWFPMKHYFGSLEYAMRWILEKQIADSGEQYDLQQAVHAIRESSNQLAKDVRKALSAVQS